MRLEHATGRGAIVWVAVSAALASMLAFGAGTVAAQDATPQASPEDALPTGILTEIVNAEGDPIGSATFAPTDDGSVSISVRVNGMEPGEHGLHIHDIGACDPSGETPFESAGGHFNPTDVPHGPGPQMASGTPMSAATPGAASPVPSTSHAGDLGNITVGDDGTGMVSITTNWVTLEAGMANSLGDADGSSIVIHAGEDDLQSQPSGDSGDRIGCGVIFPAEIVPVATPAG